MPLESREATEAAVGRLVEEWAARTYSCLVEATIATWAKSEPVQPVGTTTMAALEQEGK